MFSVSYLIFLDYFVLSQILTYNLLTASIGGTASMEGNVGSEEVTLHRAEALHLRRPGGGRQGLTAEVSLRPCEETHPDWAGQLPVYNTGKSRM